jgi:predicted O-linked N-acetylglucosamine transferase (SPINDLY family)
LAAGESERYAQHLVGALQALEPAAARLGHVAEDMVVRSLDVLQAYFHDGDLRPLMAARGRLIERFLRRRRYHLEHHFFRHPHARLRVGLLAPAYPSNTESAFALAHLTALHGTSFDVFVYAMRACPGPMEDRCSALADHFIVLPEDLRHQVGRIRRDDLDLLLVMTNLGTTTNPVTLLCAHRLARVQVASMASPVTTGLPQIDWFLSAEENDFADAGDHYTERLWRMPGSLSHFAFGPEETPMPLSRVDLGLPAEGVVFFSALNFYKLVPELVADWAAVLAAVPDSVLALLPFNPLWQVSYPEAAFRRRLERQLGVDSRRLRVLAPVPTRAHVMALLAHADVYLDGFPFAGACSLFDPLALGVPVVVREGQSARSRHGAVGARMFDRGDLVAHDSAEYVRLAIELGRNADRRAEVRSHLQQRLARGNPMLDHARFAAALVPALRELASTAPADTQEKAS